MSNLLLLRNTSSKRSSLSVRAAANNRSSRPGDQPTYEHKNLAYHSLSEAPFVSAIERIDGGQDKNGCLHIWFQKRMQRPNATAHSRLTATHNLRINEKSRWTQSRWTWQILWVVVIYDTRRPTQLIRWSKCTAWASLWNYWGRPLFDCFKNLDNDQRRRCTVDCC